MVARIPENVFLDTSVVNFILDFGEQIHDGVAVPDNVSPWVCRDIEALTGIWLIGQRAHLRLTISPGTIDEIERTRDSRKIQALWGWASELWIYSEECKATDQSKEKYLFGPTVMAALEVLPDAGDRHLIREAIKADCDAFCTRDWRTILRHREQLRAVPITFLSPHEWWRAMSPSTPNSS